MALKAMVKTLDGLEEAQKALYRKEGEGDAAFYILSVEPAEGWELTGSGLKNALTREREAREAAESKLKVFGELDPTKAHDALKKVEEMRNWTPEEKLQEQVQAKVREVADKLNAEIETLKAGRDNYRGRYEVMTLDRELAEALEANKFLAPKHIAPVFRPRVRMVEKDGQMITEVVGSDGKALTEVDTKTGASRLVTIKEFIAEQAKKPEFAELIKGAGGSGTLGNSQTPSGNNNGKPPAGPTLQNGEALDRLADAFARKS